MIIMCHFFIKILCCNRRVKDEDEVYEPTDISIPAEDIEQGIENLAGEKKNN